MKYDFERVHTVTDYWDQPRVGIADYHGIPHFYERQFDETTDEYTQSYYVTPVDALTFSLAKEKWRLWVRWRKAGSRTEAKMPPLPEDRERYAEINASLDGILKTDYAKASLVVAEFRQTTGDFADDPPGFVVRWG